MTACKIIYRKFLCQIIGICRDYCRHALLAKTPHRFAPLPPHLSEHGWAWRWQMAALFMGTNVLANPLTIYFETREPFTKIVGGNLSGQVGDPLTFALKRSGIAYEINEMPFKRYMTLIQRNAVHGCAAGAVKNAEREKLGKFSAPLVRDKPYVLIMRKGDGVIPPVLSLSDLLQDAKIRLLLHEGYSYGAYDPLLAQPTRAEVSRLPYDNVGMVRMLTQNMIDAFLMNGGEAQAVLKAVDIRPELVIHPLKDAPPGNLRYLYCSQQVSDETLAKINAFLPNLMQ